VPPRRVKVTIEQPGSKITMSFEGDVDSTIIASILKQVEARESVSPPTEPAAMANPELSDADDQSLNSRLLSLLQLNFRYGSFTSKDLKRIYENYFGRPIELSVIATYLGRYVSRGLLYRQKIGRIWFYRLPAPAISTQ